MLSCIALPIELIGVRTPENAINFMTNRPAIQAALDATVGITHIKQGR